MRTLLILAPLALAACTTPQPAPPIAPAIAAAPREPAVLYRSACAPCHDARGWATRILARRVPQGEAELTSRKQLPAAFTRTAIRRGIGAMPGFTPTDISDAEVQALAQWLERGAR